MRVLIRTSIWALRASRLAALAVPLVVIPVLMHHNGSLESDAFFLIEMIAALIALLAVVCGLVALIRLWQTGDRGWGKALGGIVVAALCLSPFAYGLYLLETHPDAVDVSTDPAKPLPLVSAPRHALINAATREQIALAYPNAQPRTYPLSSQQLFEIVDRMVEDRGWDVRLRRVPPTLDNEGVINAIVTTLLGWRDEVAIRVEGTEGGSTVNMRSVRLSPARNDLGSNGERIEEFLLALDSEVTTLLRDNPRVAPSEDDAQAQGDAAAPEAAQ